eukprot:Rmarinus@m.4235
MAILNINVGILGHVDSGKTSLARALSTHLSTAALDKHPQSKERGITLDLGFSCFFMDPTPSIREAGYEKVQITLVDCPGHASLIKTIIGGAQIIDMMILVVDVTKGIQTQTAECIVIGEVLSDELVVVLNKEDLLPEADREKLRLKMVTRLKKTIAHTAFGEAPIVSVSAAPGAKEDSQPEVGALVNLLKEKLRVPNRQGKDGKFVFAVDHCFPIKGQGTVLTGTVLHGHTKIGEVVEIPNLKVQKKIKGIQMFHRPVNQIAQGDRAGVCVAQLDADVMERGILCSPGAVPQMDRLIAHVRPIRYHSSQIRSGSKIHVTVGYDTAMATVTFFAPPAEVGSSPSSSFDPSASYCYLDAIVRPASSSPAAENLPPQAQDLPTDPSASDAAAADARGWCFALLELERAVSVPDGSKLIGARLDADIHGKACRLAFHGTVGLQMDSNFRSQLKIYKYKSRQGAVDRITHGGRTVIAKGLFKKETDLASFTGMKVEMFSPKDESIPRVSGRIESAFGKSGKVTIQVDDAEIPEKNAKSLVVSLMFKRFVYDPQKKMVQ